MGQYIVRRLLFLIPILFGITLLTFTFSKLTPGDPVMVMAGEQATQEVVQSIRHELGLDQPFLVQYGRFVWNALHGDLGKSYYGGTPVVDDIKSRFGSTFALALTALIFSNVLGISLGVIAGTARHKAVDTVTMFFALVGLSVPSFFLGIVLIMLFVVKLHWIQITGAQGIRELLLPAFCLGLGSSASLARLSRSCLLEVLRDDYVRTARAKGMQERVVIIRHVLRNALIPVVTVVGLQFGSLLGGTFIIESVFARPGLGTFSIQAVTARDYPKVMGMVLFMATVYTLVNLTVDVLYGVLDPRIRLS